jgi:hypothetical protein
MKAEHLSEMEIQQFALDKTGCEKHIADHMERCDECIAKAANYQLMFSGIKHQLKPAFDFDLTELVLTQIPETKPGFSSSLFFFYFIVVITMGSIGIAGYIFREYLFKLFTGILPMIMYLIILISLAILVFQGVEMYKKYQDRMRSLNSY